MFGSKDLLFSSEKYGVAKSLRFRSSASAYLNRTFGTATSATTWTWSGWVKRGALGATQALFGAYTDANNFSYFMFNSSDQLRLYVKSATVVTGDIATTAVYRDTSAWCHVLLSKTGTTFSLYVNGVSVSWSGTAPPSAGIINNATPHYLGQYGGAGTYFDGYLAEVNFIDGQALTPSSFGFYDNNGIWQPQGYTGTYGTNGFYLKFTDVGATSGANSGYGKDFSGFNTNYWTTNNFGTTSTATTYDSMYDSPVNASNGITGIGNYAVLNPLTPSSVANSGSVINGNLDVSINSAVYCGYFSTMQLPSSGKWYWEGQCSQNSTGSEVFSFGVASPTLSTFNINQQTGAGVYWWSFTNARYLNLNGTNTNTATTYTAGTVVMAAYDADNQKLYLGIGGTWYSAVNTTTTAPDASGSPVITTNLSGYYPAIGSYGLSNTSTINFGQRPFAYTPPSGYSALNTQNLSTPTITNGAAYMAAVTYTGSASTQSVTATSTNSGNNPNAVTFQPDLVWIKDRSNAQDHKWTDVVRGATKALESNTTDDEATDSNGVTAFNNNGFSLGTGTRAYSDSNGDSYIAWEWKENVSSGFDIVTYTGNGSARTISHSLNAVPNMIIVKARTTASTDQGWPVYHSANTSAPETDYLMLNTTAATADLDTVWNDTAPTSAVFSVGTNANVNANNDTYVAYLWAAIAGYSAFGSYAGNSSADGPFVYTGFRPRWIMIKITTLGGSAGYDWYIFDTSRNTYNAADLKIVANSSVIENQNSGGSSMAGFPIDILSNGFKIRNSGGNWNASSNTYIYAAFAENPFKISRAR